MIRRPACLLVVAVALVLAGCAPKPAERTSGDAADTTAVTAVDSSRVVIEPIDAQGLLAAVRAPGAQATLVNVWASWCQPCREEFPDLVRLERDYRGRGLRVLFVSADFDDQLAETRQFLVRHGVTTPSFIKTGDDMQFINAMDRRWSGALPATFLYDRSGKLRAFREGKADYWFFEHEVLAILASQPTAPPKEGPS